jgi:predicted RNase H-like HicB family nuclease
MKSRGYVVELRHEEDDSWTAAVPDLPGAVAVGATPDEAVGDLPTVIDLWIATATERGMPVPTPEKQS